ncbi:hypothetical protein [Mobilicoccus sp.]|uniref:hypothetical protein n=1 Tax=Mobilicoccus sp. TaxID=2034349 RepID=UPI0028A7D3AB|nr:hypothetical protein [Mobilicoccus sp.]
MNPETGSATPDAASCAALGAGLRREARRLQEACAEAGTEDGRGADATDRVAEAMERLGGALENFAVAVRGARPTRPGLAHPQTTLRAVAREVGERLHPTPLR